MNGWDLNLFTPDLADVVLDDAGIPAPEIIAGRAQQLVECMPRLAGAGVAIYGYAFGSRRIRPKAPPQA